MGWDRKLGDSWFYTDMIDFLKVFTNKQLPFLKPRDSLKTLKHHWCPCASAAFCTSDWNRNDTGNGARQTSDTQGTLAFALSLLLHIMSQPVYCNRYCTTSMCIVEALEAAQICTVSLMFSASPWLLALHHCCLQHPLQCHYYHFLCCNIRNTKVDM